MKYFAILKDSFREAIDSKVFFVVLGISALLIFVMATITLEPNSPEPALHEITTRFADGSEVEVGAMGEFKDPRRAKTQYSVEDVQATDNSTKPWLGEHHFVIVARDIQPWGTRIVCLLRILKKDKDQERQLDEDMKAEAQRIMEKEGRKDINDLMRDPRLLEKLLAYRDKLLEEKVRALSPEQLKEFIKVQLEDQGNWDVKDVQLVDLPDSQKKIKIQGHVLIPEGDDFRIKAKETEGELNKFRVTVTSRAGTYRVWPHDATVFFGAIPLQSAARPGQLVKTIVKWGVSVIGSAIILLLSCIITAFFIPNMLSKGTIDLLLVKPINRVGLLCYKYIGGLTFMFLNTVILVTGLWIALGIRTGIWEPSILNAIFILTFEFALFYALSTLIGVLTRSPVVCILGCVLMWVLLFSVGWVYYFAAVRASLNPTQDPDWFTSTAQTVHKVLPHYLDLDWLGNKTMEENLLDLSERERGKLAEKNAMVNWSESIMVSSLYIFIFLGLSCWRFAVKDY